MKYYILSAVLIALAFVVFMFCNKSQMPEKAVVIKNFDIEQYKGQWYEIARIDNKFEKDLIQTTATYSLNTDGSVKVVNKGLDKNTNEWKQAIGKAKFRGDKSQAALKVSFFGPFYSGYNVLALEDYKYSLVAGRNFEYLWILGREKTIPEDIKTKFLEIAENVGYNTKELLWVYAE